MRVLNELLFSNQTVTSSATSLYQDLTHIGFADVTASIVGTGAGSVKLQKNLEPSPLPPIWFDIPSSSQTFTDTSLLNWPLTDIGYIGLQAIVTVGSGSVVINLRINGKGF